MQRRRPAAIVDLYSDPFGEQPGTALLRERVRVLGCDVRFESNSRELMRLVRAAYAGLPVHRLARVMPELTIRLFLAPARGVRTRAEPPPLAMVAGAGFLGGAMARSSFVALSPAQRAALVVVSPEMLRFPYHTRYELIEFAVFTLAARVQRLVPLHAACVGRDGRGVLLMGASGSGKSTVSLLCLLSRLEFLSEDSVFVEPRTLMATGVANFLHVRANSLPWVNPARERAAMRNSPVIRRRSGVQKYEVDLRRSGYRLARGPLKIASVVFLSAAAARGRELLRPLDGSEMRARLAEAQAYAAGQPRWREFCARLERSATFELRRGRHPAESVDALRGLLEAGI